MTMWLWLIDVVACTDADVYAYADYDGVMMLEFVYLGAHPSPDMGAPRQLYHWNLVILLSAPDYFLSYFLDFLFLLELLRFLLVVFVIFLTLFCSFKLYFNFCLSYWFHFLFFIIYISDPKFYCTLKPINWNELLFE